MDAMRRFFRLDALGTTVATELRAGLVTFLSLSYILVVNPQILSEAGMPATDVAVATAVASAIACLVMGLYANYPFALAPGMGMNAYFTYGVVIGLDIHWTVALGAVFVEGLLFLLLTVTGIRGALTRAIPLSIKTAAMSGVGLMLAIIGFQAAGLIVAHPVTLVTLGDLHAVSALLGLAGLLLTGALLARRVPGAILVGILAITAVSWGLGLAPSPERVLAAPAFPKDTFLAFGLADLLSAPLLSVIAAFLFVDLFDTAGTLMGLGMLTRRVDSNGELDRATQAYTADAVGTVAGAVLGTSPVTSFVESATGVEEGGRSGLTAVTVAGLFLLSLFFVPLIVAVPRVASAPALVVVGALMMQGARRIDWSRADESLPAFLTVVTMPFTYSIANGISVGIVSWVGIRLLAGRIHEVSPLMYALAGLVVAFYGLGLAG